MRELAATDYESFKNFFRKDQEHLIYFNVFVGKFFFILRMDSSMFSKLFEKTESWIAKKIL